MSKASQAQSYPLHWPAGFPRTRSPGSSKFKSSLTAALNNVQTELQRFAKDSGVSIKGIIVSSNFSLSDQRPADAGVAVYFQWGEDNACIAVDKYSKIEDNLQAISLVIDAKRAMIRHGGLNLVKAAFRGYLALPPNSTGKRSWRTVLGVTNPSASLADVKACWRASIALHHPDRGGNAAKAAEINQAWEDAQKELTA